MAFRPYFFVLFQKKQRLLPIGPSMDLQIPKMVNFNFYRMMDSNECISKIMYVSLIRTKKSRILFAFLLGKIKDSDFGRHREYQTYGRFSIGFSHCSHLSKGTSGQK